MQIRISLAHLYHVHSFYALAVGEGALNVTHVHLSHLPAPSVHQEHSQNCFLLSNFKLPQPNILKLIHNAYLHKSSSKLNVITLTIHELCSFINIILDDFFVSFL